MTSSTRHPPFVVVNESVSKKSAQSYIGTVYSRLVSFQPAQDVDDWRLGGNDGRGVAKGGGGGPPWVTVGATQFARPVSRTKNIAPLLTTP